MYIQYRIKSTIITLKLQTTCGLSMVGSIVHVPVLAVINTLNLIAYSKKRCNRQILTQALTATNTSLVNHGNNSRKAEL